MHTYNIYQVNFKNETILASMQNFSEIKVTIIVLHSKNEIISVFPPIEHYRLLCFCYSKMPFFHIKRETKLKRKWNMALYDHNDEYQLKCLKSELMLVMHKQPNVLPQWTLFSAHITTLEYVAHYNYYFVVSGEINITKYS